MVRKIATAFSVFRRCRNWPELLASRLGYEPKSCSVSFRDGWQLKVSGSVSNSWGQFFEAAIADVYGIRDAAPDLIVDVGANIGSFACLAARLHPKAQVYAFEPQRRVAVVLQRNLQLNRIRNVELITSPVTRDARNVEFWSHTADGASGIYLPAQNASSVLSSVTLGCVPFRQHKKAFIKLDCEGAESEIVEWLVEQQTGLSDELTLACEYHQWAPRSLANTATLLTNAGWEVSTRQRFGEQYLFGWLRSHTPARLGQTFGTAQHT